MASWRYATPEECVEFDQLPEVKGPPSAPEIFTALSGFVTSRDGEVLSVPSGKLVKLLQGDGGEPWVYRTQTLRVQTLGADLVLMEGLPVAIFSLSKT